MQDNVKHVEAHMNVQGAEHGGDSFRAIGTDFKTLENFDEVIAADVLDAWFDPSPIVLKKLTEFLPFLAKSSPPIHAEGLVRTVAEVRGVKETQVVVGPGSSSLIFSTLPLVLDQVTPVMVLNPMYSEYEHFCRHSLHLPIVRHDLSAADNFVLNLDRMREEAVDAGVQAIFLVNPNSPTGVHCPLSDVLEFLRALPQNILVWVDETYVDYASSAESLEPYVGEFPNLVVLKSMSKAYALSGVRVGYLVTEKARAARLLEVQPPWSVGLLGQLAGVEALKDRAYYESQWRETAILRQRLSARLAQLPGVQVFPSVANFVLLWSESAPALARHLELHKVFVRAFSEESGLGRTYLRIAVKGGKELDRMLTAIDAFPI